MSVEGIVDDASIKSSDRNALPNMSKKYFKNRSNEESAEFEMLYTACHNRTKINKYFLSVIIPHCQFRRRHWNPKPLWYPADHKLFNLAMLSSNNSMTCKTN